MTFALSCDNNDNRDGEVKAIKNKQISQIGQCPFKCGRCESNMHFLTTQQKSIIKEDTE